MLVPGLGQFMLGHRVEGPFVFLMEMVLLSSGANDGFYLTSKWQSRVEGVEKRLAGPFPEQDLSFLDKQIPGDSLYLVDSLELYQGEYEYSRAIRDRMLVWVAGFHLFNVLDCWHYLSRDRHKGERRNPRNALLRSLFVPGWGQFYNREYSKLGLFIMSAAGFSANIFVWNRAAGYYSTLESKYRGLFFASASALASAERALSEAGSALMRIDSGLADTALSAAVRDSLMDEKNRFSAQHFSESARKEALSHDRGYFSAREEGYGGDKTSYLSKRNQNIWYLVAIYLYAAFDAYVDASVSGLENRLDFSLVPTAGEGLRLSMKINF